MSTPQELARNNFAQQTNGQRQQQQQQQQHVFQAQVQPGLQSPSPAQRALQTFPRPTPPPGLRAQNLPYSTPYALNNPSPGPPRQNGNGLMTAEQQIAQGVLNHPAAGSGANTPQRRPPPLGKQVHVPAQSSPQVQSMNINHAMNPSPATSQAHGFDVQRQSHPGSPALQNLNTQRPSMNRSPVNSPLHHGLRQHDSSPVDMMNDGQDMSMIDPQLALDQQLIGDANNSMMGQGSQMGSIMQMGSGSQLGQGSPMGQGSQLGHGSPDDDGAGPQVVPGEMLSAPPKGSYPTFEALFAAAQAHALAHGYAFVIGRSKRDNRGLKKVFLICDRGGNNKEKVPGEQRQRKTKSRKCGCEFGVFGLENKTAWLLRGRIDGEHLEHNHPPSESPTEHPGARKLDPKAIAAVKALEENGVSVKETLEILHRDNPSVRYLPRDIYNARAAIKRDPSRVEATAMEALPTFYKKPPMTFEEKLRAELRTEVANAQEEIAKVKQEWREEVEDLKEQLLRKDKQIAKFEMFIDICNERVMAQREKVFGGESSGNPSG